ncbi:uncharacterized protein LOC126837308 isoform X2 [Adelges cooleyi]|uniref:uncharacterized protein LOC126837308 isoform X2 n=1 Tax=Adelges cooleyi TaxID=133065 RepID=UPI00217FDC6B|nr:uncharacterized protein LOC126837308 isoform X2 [Adelges cooleyi]
MIKQKRQLFREHVLPFLGGKIPDSAFRADRLALNMLNKEGISVPDGILFDISPRESHHQSSRVDPELSNSIVKMLHTPDGRYVPSEGKHDFENEVETTYRIVIPSNYPNYQLPRFKPLPGTLQLPIRQIFDGGFRANTVQGQLGVPFYPQGQNWGAMETDRNDPLYRFKYGGGNNIVQPKPQFNNIHLTNFVCDGSGRMYPDPEAQCQVFHLCHYNGFKESFVCPEGTRYDATVQECRPWYLTPCLNGRGPY